MCLLSFLLSFSATEIPKLYATIPGSYSRILEFDNMSMPLYHLNNCETLSKILFRSCFFSNILSHGFTDFLLSMSGTSRIV
jgi:hypothetical protein